MRIFRGNLEHREAQTQKKKETGKCTQEYLEGIDKVNVEQFRVELANTKGTGCNKTMPHKDCLALPRMAWAWSSNC